MMRTRPICDKKISVFSAENRNHRSDCAVSSTGSLFLIPIPCAKFRPNRSSFRGDMHENVKKWLQCWHDNKMVIVNNASSSAKKRERNAATYSSLGRSDAHNLCV